MRGRVRVTVQPSENEDKVIQAVLGILPEATLQPEGTGPEAYDLSGPAGDLSLLWWRIRERKVVAAAREALIRAQQGSGTRLELSKQPATQGVPVLAIGGEALGEIVLELWFDEGEGDLAGWLDTELPDHGA